MAAITEDARMLNDWNQNKSFDKFAGGLTCSAFMAFFRPHVRVLFDWDRFAHERWPVHVKLQESIEDIDELRLPWFVQPPRRGEVHYTTANAQQITVGSLRSMGESGHFALLDKERRQAVDEMADQLRQRPPAQLILPVYSVDTSRARAYFALDGSHRLAALARHEISFRALSFIVHGPLDPTILADLTALARGDEELPL